MRHALTLFLTPSFYVIVLVIIIDDYGVVQFTTTIVDYGLDKGMTLDVAKSLISFFAFGTLLGRVGVPFASDIAPRMRAPLYVFGFLFNGALLVVMPEVLNYGGVAAITFAHGMCKGTALCLRCVFTCELLGIGRMAACSGIAGLCLIPLSLVSPGILGVKYDITLSLAFAIQ
ncbi:hypothetical protein HPB50_024182 [Hyalomma asiaticum]|uniref:Uncharacterized protein n=1 Tax=Hyalomma asiaticum TaxID=266040 RepID=A0ACB7SK25_HYAAI|nr:hypothetical protein HPB50_024182 [Hyalomma asiaticum]